LPCLKKGRWCRGSRVRIPHTTCVDVTLDMVDGHFVRNAMTSRFRTPTSVQAQLVVSVGQQEWDIQCLKKERYKSCLCTPRRPTLTNSNCLTSSSERSDTCPPHSPNYSCLHREPGRSRLKRSCTRTKDRTPLRRAARAASRRSPPTGYRALLASEA